MNKNALRVGLLIALLTFLALSACVQVDQVLIGTWKNDTTDLTIQFKDDGTIALTGTYATIVYALSLGSTIKYTAANGAGEWWFSNLLLGEGTKTAFTYAVSGTTLTSDIFYEGIHTYTYTKQ
jgi:hypothetical protein